MRWPVAARDRATLPVAFSLKPVPAAEKKDAISQKSETFLRKITFSAIFHSFFLRYEVIFREK
jgi:hypothetical protein